MDPASVPDPFWKLSDFTITHKSPLTSLSTLTKHLPSMAAAKRLHSEIPVLPAGEAILCAPKAIAGTFRRSNDQEASSITTLGNGYLRIRPRLLVENLPETYSPEDPLPDFSHIQPARTITLTGDLAQFIPLIKRMQRDTKVGHSNTKTLRKHFSRKDRTAYGAKTKALDSVFEAAIKMGVVIKEGTPPKSREKLLLIPRATYVFPAGGIGQATAKALAQQGCSIAVHHSSDASKSKAQDLIAELTQHEGVRAAAFQADLSTYENTKSLYDDVVKRLGHPDILFGNHGATKKTIGPTGDIGDISPELFEETWKLNTGTNFYLSPVVTYLSDFIFFSDRRGHWAPLCLVKVRYARLGALAFSAVLQGRNCER
ncbi:hypothetical protein PHLCEN_2v10956 [Hermanssonia centrifuga]|uniref:NAD(P)-binding protein n=1 Tax=Hermanssonia centrifuga TaxID=98765 RepID=A0A2R6NLB6_9APHY|nr:hypothetical protein PHLCEN_2v10956 [Hermanssonia centrifuga]